VPKSAAEKQRRRAAKRQGTREPVVDADRCTSDTLAGDRCPNSKVTVTLPLSGKKIDLEDGVPRRVRLRTCLAHAPESVREAAGFLRHGKGGRQKRPTVPQLLRQQIEDQAGEIMATYFEALQAEKPVVVGNGPHAKLELVPDPSVRMRASDSLLDRVYGRPKQTTEVTGHDGGAVRVHLPSDEERARQVAEVLKQAGVEA
jgi:hypothetical protein